MRGAAHRPRGAFHESGCLGMQPKMGGRLLLKLNIGTRPIANKYREGKMKSTLKRKLTVRETVGREAHGISKASSRFRLARRRQPARADPNGPSGRLVAPRLSLFSEVRVNSCWIRAKRPAGRWPASAGVTARGAESDSDRGVAAHAPRFGLTALAPCGMSSMADCVQCA